jgi:PAS domain S-box-containing protein
MLLDIQIFTKILQVVSDSILLVDKIGMIHYLNKGVTTLFGYTENELIGNNIQILLSENLRKKNADQAKMYDSTGKLLPIWQEKTNTGQNKNGETFFLEINLSPIIFNKKNYLIAVIKDITEKKLQEKKLAEKTLELEQFVYITSHNLQEPLKSIEQLLILLNEEGLESSNQSVKEIYSRIRRASFHMSELIKGILIFSRLEKKTQLSKLEEKNLELEQFVYIVSHNLQEPLKSIDQLLNLLTETSAENTKDIYLRIRRATLHMSDLIKDLLVFSKLGKKGELSLVNCNKAVDIVKESLKALIEKNQAQIIIKGVLPTIRIYETEFQVLLQNLIDNAIKFHKNNIHPVVTIKAKQTPSGYIFSIQDNGIGIEEKFIGKLFFMFQRFQNQKDFSGNGIGLAHCKKVIDVFGGNIWVESLIGKGSTFFFSIPNLIKEIQ